MIPDDFYNEEGDFIGPKYWSSDMYLDPNGNYAVDGYKWDDYCDTTYVVLGPATRELEEAARRLRADASINQRVDGLTASIRHEQMSPILWISMWDWDCNAHISLYRTARFRRLRRMDITARIPAPAS